MTRPNLGGRPISLPEPWASLARALGGVAALAEAAGIDVRNLRRWAHGEATPGRAQRRAVNAMARRRGIQEPWRE